MIDHFKYEGAVGPQVDSECRTCMSAKAGMCIRGPDPNHNETSCGTCAAGKRGRCDLHGRGLKTALDEHKMLDAADQVRFEKAKADLLEEIASLKPTTKVSVHVSASRATPEQVSMGAYPREVLVHYKQLDQG